MHLMTPLKPVEHNSNQIVYCMSMNSLCCEYHRFVVPERLLRRVQLRKPGLSINYVPNITRLWSINLLQFTRICAKYPGILHLMTLPSTIKIWFIGNKSVSRPFPYPEPVVFQWQSSGNPVCLELRPRCTLECHWINASVLPVVFQWLSSGLPVCSNYANQHWIATGTPLGASISQCGSNGTQVYLWFQWSSSVVCPVVSQCTDIIWFGGH